ncbi:metallophosphoesterase [Virgibacillus oceani]
MNRKLAISDIHGHGELLLSLLHAACYHPPFDQLILLGDYIHKGPDTKGTINIIRELWDQEAVVLRGNHEQKVIDALPGTQYFMERGKNFFHHMPLYYEDNQYIYVHAGIRPGIPMKLQLAEDLLRIREPFLNQPHQLPKQVIFGHTSTDRLGMANHIWVRPDKIGIDTGAGHGKTLSLVDLTNKEVYSCHVKTGDITRQDFPG